MMAGRLDEELALVRKRHPTARLGPGDRSLLIDEWRLPSGWSSTQVRLMVVIPSGYPTTPPDNFYTTPDLVLAGGREPGNTSHVDLEGARWRQFSYHVEASDWRPHAVVTEGHNLLTFLEAVEKRLSELS